MRCLVKSMMYNNKISFSSDTNYRLKFRRQKYFAVTVSLIFIHFKYFFRMHINVPSNSKILIIALHTNKEQKNTICSVALDFCSKTSALFKVVSFISCNLEFKYFSSVEKIYLTTFYKL